MMPTVGAEQTRLAELFVGTWKGEEKLYPSEWDPKGGSALGTWTVRAAVDGFCLVVDYDEERDGTVVYRGHGIHGWQDNAQCYFVYWFDNMGVMPAQAIKAKLEGNRYTYQSNDGPTGWTRMTYEWIGDRFEFRIDKSKDGTAWSPMHEGKYTRMSR
ncbi:MAG: DUF1579 family protein [Kofleriaceae bacterium]